MRLLVATAPVVETEGDMWEALCKRLVARHLSAGSWRLTFPSGDVVTIGDAPARFALRLLGSGSCRRLIRNPGLALGELYTEGKLEIERGELIEILETILSERFRRGRAPRRFRGYANPPGASRRNVEHHYDLGEGFYRRFLDSDMQYSCAYWAPGTENLEEAQDAKRRHIAAKLCLRPGQSVLDIGCGWGGLALHLARRHDVRVTGITLSPSQLETARKRARDEGLEHRVTFKIADYRELDARFDRVVSVGMLEHVGPKDLKTYFGRVRELLVAGGVALVHSIGRAGPPRRTAPWIEKHIFPGGQLPALSELAKPIERSGLWLADLEVLRLHYARTLHAWRDRFEAQADAVAAERGKEFVRLWRFYLCASEAAFTAADQLVYQIQLGTGRDAVPLTRDYLYDGHENTVGEGRLHLVRSRAV